MHQIDAGIFNINEGTFQLCQMTVIDDNRRGEDAIDGDDREDVYGDSDVATYFCGEFIFIIM